MYGESKIIGKTILSFNLSKDKTELVLKTDSGDLKFIAVGDCCSHSWIEHISEPSFPAKILSVDEKSMGKIGEVKDYGDVVKQYSTIFKTNKGDFEIEYRNSSNGYYGGDLKLVDHNYES